MSVLDTFSLAGKVAVVTGAESRIGRSIVRALAEAGAKVILASRNLVRLEAAAERYRADGFDVRAEALDQADEASVLALRDRVFAAEGHLDVLVNNAVSRTMKGWDDPLEAFAESLKVNATGLFAMVRAFGDGMARSGRGGSIVNVGSTMAHKAIQRGPDGFLQNVVPEYFFAKGGMLSLTRLAASYYAKDGVRVNCLTPSAYRTEESPEGFVQAASRATMLGRMLQGDDLAGAVVFLASDASAFVTGANLAVDGGATAM